MTDPVDAVRGPQAEWVNSKCPVCGGYYFGAALEYAQRLHDKHEQGRCAGRLVEIPQRERRRQVEFDWSAPDPAGRPYYLSQLRPDQPCGHPGCLSHVTHPCEGCGRIADRWPKEKQP